MPKKVNYYPPMEADYYYHVFNRANSNGDVLFRSDENYRYFLKKWDAYLSPYLKIYAYCLLPNHFHFLVQVKSEDTIRNAVSADETMKKHKTALVSTILSEVFRRFFIAYAKAFNHQQGRRGSLFQKDFKRILVDKDSYFTSLIYYIHANPLKHGTQQDFVNYQWNSYQRILHPKPTKLEKRGVLDWFGGRTDYVTFHQREHNWGDIEHLLVE